MASDVSSRDGGSPDQPAVPETGRPGWFDGTWTDGGVLPASEDCVDRVDNDGDGETDCADSDCVDRLICQGSLSDEVEWNDSVEDANLLTLPAAIRGVIGAPTRDVEAVWFEDIDWFTVAVDGPALLRWRFDDANGPALLTMSWVGLDVDVNEDVVRVLDLDTPGTARELYLPVGGTYGIAVRDIRNTVRSAEEMPYGGDEFAYAFSVEQLDLRVEPVALPLETSERSFDGDNALPVFAVTVAAGEVLQAELVAERLTSSSGLDGILLLVDGESGEVIAVNDDSPTGTRDPFIRTNVFDETTSAVLVVDARKIQWESTYSLTVESLEIGQDAEPNAPIELAFPGVVGETVSGEIGAPYQLLRDIVADTDYYYLAGGREDSYLIEVEALGSELDLAVRTGFLGSSNETLVLGEVFLGDPADRRDVRLEVTSLFPSRMYIEVSDRANRFGAEETADDPEIEAPQPVGGGALFLYDLSVTPFEREFRAIELPHASVESISFQGETDWYELSVAPMTRLVVSASEQAEGFEPWIVLATAEDAFTRWSSRTLEYLSAFETSYRLLVRDKRGGGGADFVYDLSVAVQTFSELEEIEPNDTVPEATPLGDEGPWWVAGEVGGANRDNFDRDVFLLTVEASVWLTIETTVGVGDDGEDTDTLVTLTGGLLDEPIFDDKAGVADFSRISGVELSVGTYEITVEPDCDEEGCDGGEYSLVVWWDESPPID